MQPFNHGVHPACDKAAALKSFTARRREISQVASSSRKHINHASQTIAIADLTVNGKMVYHLWIGPTDLINVSHHDVSQEWRGEGLTLVAWIGLVISSLADNFKNPDDRREQLVDEIDDNDFDWQIFWVAGFGFLTDSYNLFSTNVILPSLAFVYWTKDTATDHETNINAITLTGSLLGQLIFGYLSDRFGRRKLYGLELIIVIFGTLGLVQCSAGYSNASMSVLGLIMLWRFFVGIGR